MSPTKKIRCFRKQGHERGSMLLDLMIAVVVLAIGMGGILVLLVSAMYTDNRAGNDTSSTMIAEHVIEQISSPMAADTGTMAVTDCAQTNWTISTVGALNGGGTSGAYGGNGAALTSAGVVDWNQSYSTVPTGYKMKYVSCGAGGTQITYDVRWNVVRTSFYSRMIFVAARPSSTAKVGGLRYVLPVTLRTIGGM